MQNNSPLLLGFAAASGTGKTTLLTQLIPLLKQQGLRVGLIKHSHHNFEMDQPGKDSFRLRAAGANPVLLVSSHRQAMITDINPSKEPTLAEQVRMFQNHDLDLILVEGFRTEAFPKIELYRAELNNPFLYPDDAKIIAVASDIPLQLPKPLVQLDLNNPVMIAEFIQRIFLTGVL
jgi:molybdopterin-guanine dinucleotide biosynthesis protein MobB